MEQLQQPGPLSLQGNLSENWRRWKQQFTIYVTATGKTSASDEVKFAIFLHLVGPVMTKSDPPLFVPGGPFLSVNMDPPELI